MEVESWVLGKNTEMFVSTSKSMVKSNINVDTDFTDYTDFQNHDQSV